MEVMFCGVCDDNVVEYYCDRCEIGLCVDHAANHLSTFECVLCRSITCIELRYFNVCYRCYENTTRSSINNVTDQLKLLKFG